MIAKQGFDEVIVVDSSSPGQRYKNEELCRELGVKYHYRAANRQEARNFGAEMAKGEWVWFRDDDVKLIDAGLESLREEIASKECDFVHAAAKAVWIFRRDFFLEIGGFDTKLCLFDDYDMAFRARKYGKGCKLSQPLGKTAEFEKNAQDHLKATFFYGLSFPNFFKKYPSLRSSLSIPDYIAFLLGEFLRARTRYNLIMFLVGTLGFLSSTLYFIYPGVFYESLYPLSK